MSAVAPAANGPKGNPMQQDSTLSSLATGLPGYQATPTMPSMPSTPAMPTGDNSSLTFMLTQVWQQSMQTRTDIAVMQATITQIKAQTSNIEHDLGTRVKELETARLTEASRDGALRADLTTQITNAMIAAQREANAVDQRQSSTRNTNSAMYGSQLASAAVAGGLVLLGIIINLIIVLVSVHHP